MRSDSFQSERDLIDDLPEYRAINGLVVVSFVLLVPSALAVLHPAFIGFSVLSLLLAVASIWRTAAGAGAQRYGVGWTVLGLAVVMTVLPVSLHYLNQRREYSFVVGSVNRWLELLRGENPVEAYYLSLEPGLRPDPGKHGVDQSGQTNQRMIGLVDTEEQFRDGPGVKAFADPRNTPEYVALVKRPASFKRKEYWLTYRIHVPDPVPHFQIGIIEFQQLPDLGPPLPAHWRIGACRVLD